MATIEIGTVVGPITDGGGAAAVTVDVFNAMWANAQSKAEASLDNINEAIAIADPAPQLVAPTLDKSYLPPAPPVLPDDDPNNGEEVYNDQLAKLLALIQDSMADFIAEFFPNPQFYEHAIDWCDRAIIDGGTGINSNVEAALWQRGRARILADSERAAAEAEQLWAGRKFPLPPGALTSQINQINLDAGRKLAEVNRDIAVKSFDTEIENVRFAVKTVIDQRKVALDAMGDYIRTLMLGPQTAMQLATGLENLKGEAARNMVMLYSAQVNAAQPGVQLAISDATLQLEASKANLLAQESTIDAKVKAALQGAQMTGSMAAAGLNAINSSSSISGSDSTSV